jgi:hypothetical protein
LAGREPAIKGVMIDANSGGYCTLALIGLPQVSLQELYQLIRACCHFVCYDRLRVPNHRMSLI